MREEVFEPLGMDDCWVGMPPERHAAYGDRIGTMHTTPTGAGAVPLDLARLRRHVGEVRARRRRARPDAPVRAAVPRAAAEAVSSTACASSRPQTVEAMAARHRVGLFDETYHVPCDWGLGVQVDDFAMGGYASPRAFGHGGALSSFTFADPEQALVVAVQTNGMCGNDDHYRRLDDDDGARSTSTSGSCREGAPGREKPMPQVSFAAASAR